MARIAVPLAEDFEDSEFTVPCERLRTAGHEVIVVGSKKGESVKGKRGKAEVTIDAAAKDVRFEDFDALVIPGGYSPDKLRTDADVVMLIRKFAKSGKLVAAICHGPQLLIEADVVGGKTLTSWPSVRRDIENAGGHWVDKEICADGSLVTSRKPEDLDAFCAAILKRLR